MSSHERNIDTRNNEKSNKYAHFTTDITHLSCKVNSFEVSTKEFLNTRNHSTLNTQICQTWHHQDTVQVKHICTQPHSLISHFPLQGQAHLHGAPLPSPTFGDQDQDCDCNLIDIHLWGLFVKWDQQPVSGQCMYMF